MKNLVLFTGLILAAFTGVSQTQNFVDRPYIEVNGIADTLLTPNEIYIRISLSEKDSKDRETLEALEIKMVDVLINLGINTERDLTASDLASNFKSHFLKRTDILKVKEYMLKVPTALLATQVIIDLEEAGISNTSIDRVDHFDIERIRMSMRGKASENARKRALAFVAPLNQEIGKAIFISETNQVDLSGHLSGRVAGIVVTGYAAEGVKMKEKLPSIEFEKIRVEVAVQMKFELEGVNLPEK